MSLSSLLVAVIAATSFHTVSCQQCTSVEQCYPQGYEAGGIYVPPTLVNCSDGQCDCNDCFFQSSDGICTVDTPCQTYDTARNTCRDHRRSQETGVVLSAVLSPVGAANFYIARYEYAIPQLVLLVVLIVASLFGRVVRCFSSEKRRETEKFFVMCSTIVAAVIAVLALLIIIAWWIADLVIFIKNTRRDGNDCPLREDL